MISFARNSRIYFLAALFLTALVGAFSLDWGASAQRRSGGQRIQDFSKVLLAPEVDGDFDIGFITTDRLGTVPTGVSRIQFPNGAANSAAGSDTGTEVPIFVGRQSDGKLVAVLQAFVNSQGINNIALVRLNTNGTIDSTFGGAPGGKVIVPVPSPAGVEPDHRSPRPFKAVMSGDKIIILGQVSFGVDDGGSPTNICQNGNANATDFLIVVVNADGTLDANFDGDPLVQGNGNGQVRVQVGNCDDNPIGIAVDSNGEIVVGGASTDYGLFNAMDNSNQQVVSYFVFFRLNTDGTLDTAYDLETAHDPVDDGIAKHRTSSAGLPVLPLDPSIPGNELGSSDLRLIQSGPHQNKLIVFGGGNHSGHTDFLLNRIDNRGQIDTTFASNAGFVKTHTGSNGQSSSAIQGHIYSDGTNRVLGAGYAISGGNQVFSLVRYSVDGVLDTATFGAATGIVTVHGFNVNGQCNIQTSALPIYGVDVFGRIVIGGQGLCPDNAYSGGTALDLVMARLSSAGAVDAGFGSGGRIITHFDASGGGTDFALAPAGGTMLPNGKIVPFGQMNVAGSGEQDMYVALFRNATQTAAAASVSGRVLAYDGRGLTNAVVTITGMDGSTQTIITGRNGRFTFESVETGATYIVSVASRRFSFEPQTVLVNDNVSGLLFMPQ